MSDLKDLLHLIKKAAQDVYKQMQPANILFGTVISENPLIIETDQKLVLTHEFLSLTRNVTDFQTIISFDNPDIKQRFKTYDKPEDEPVIKPSDPPPKETGLTDLQFLWTDYREGNNSGNEKPGKQPTRHTVTVYNHLLEDERVVMVKEAGGQRYVVLDREGVMEDGERCFKSKYCYW